MYNIIANVDELKWFYDHVIVRPQINESYSMVFVCRYKKLTAEERVALGIAKREAEFLATQSVRLGKIKDASQEPEWTFDKFLKAVKRFQVDQYAYTTSAGFPLPEKVLATIFYVNPCDDIKVADQVIEKINSTKTSLTKALLNGKDLNATLQAYQTFGNLESLVKHAKANCKGSVYWLDYDIDVPDWFKLNYYHKLKALLTEIYGLGNYLIIETCGGYHVLVKTCVIKQNPKQFTEKVHTLYTEGIAAGYTPYVDEKGTEKFECIVNDSQIPGLPLPGTYQYGKPVVVLNKEDFE